MVTVYAVHFSRYDGRMYGIDDVRWKKTVSLLAVLSGVVGGVSLILLAVMDTFRFHEEHAVLLLVCFLGLAMSALLTTVVYWDQMWYPSPFKRLRTLYVPVFYAPPIQTFPLMLRETVASQAR